MARFRETAERGLTLAPNRSDILAEIIVLDPALVAHGVEGLRKTGLQTAC